MSDMWIRTVHGGLINMDSVDTIDIKVHYKPDGVTKGVVSIHALIHETSNLVMVTDTLEEAKKCILKIHDYMNQGVKCIDCEDVLRQVQGEKSS